MNVSIFVAEDVNGDDYFWTKLKYGDGIFYNQPVGGENLQNGGMTAYYPYGVWTQDVQPSGWGQGFGNDRRIFNTYSNVKLRVLVQSVNAVGYFDDLKIQECDEAGNIIVAPTQITLADNSSYSIQNGYISNIGMNTALDTFKANFNQADSLLFDDIVGTGKTVKLMKNSTEIHRLTIVIKGDIDGNGNVTVEDLAKVKQSLLKLAVLENAYSLAADVNDDTRITISDLIKIKKAIIGIGSL
jgi:hypothetical protein